MIHLFTCILCSSLLVFSVSAPPTLYAQQKKEITRFGVGGQAGRPTGVTLKYYLRQGLGITLLTAWNRRRKILINSQLIFELPIPDSPLQFYTGPGAFIERDENNNNLTYKAGIGVAVGLNFYVEKFEVFLQANPELEVHPTFFIRPGGAVGLRYFF